MFGVNVDINNDASYAIAQPLRVRGDGFYGVRSTAYKFQQSRTDAYKQVGLKFCAIITGQSAGYIPPNADFLQISNEDDLWASPDFYYWNWWKPYRETYPEFVGKFMSSAMASATTNWVPWIGRVIQLCKSNGTPLPDFIDVHPYTLTVQQASDAIDNLWNVFQIPVTVTEWSYTDHFNAGTLESMQCMLGNMTDGRARDWNSGFCYDDNMKPDFGLYDSSGTPKQSYFGLLGWEDPNGCRT